jgi:hypothetical protein
MQTKEHLLTDLLVGLFSPEELGRFVRFGPDGAALYRLLSWTGPPLVVAAETVDLLRRHGLIDANLFDRLVDLRPTAVDRIRDVQRLWVTPPASQPPQEHVPGSDSTSRAHAHGGEPARIFVSYSHRDRSFVEELGSHLKLLQRQGLIEVWSDSEITAGQEWHEVINEGMERADIFLLMVSASFLSSDFCWGIEVKRALERHDQGSAIVVPVILRPCLWKESPLARLQALPKDAKPISTHRNTDEVWSDVADAIRGIVVRGLHKPRPGERP